MFQTLKRLVKFALVGGSGAVVGLVVLYLLTYEAGLYYLVGYIISFCVSVFTNYVLNSRWTFKSGKLSFRGYCKYFGASLVTLGITSVLMYLFTSVIGIWYMASSVIVTCICFPINYVMSRKLVWRSV